MMERKQFTFYRSFWEAIENLPTNKEKLQAYQMLCAYGLNQEEPQISAVKPSAATVFQICNQMHSSYTSETEKCISGAGCGCATHLSRKKKCGFCF